MVNIHICIWEHVIVFADTLLCASVDTMIVHLVKKRIDLAAAATGAAMASPAAGTRPTASRANRAASRRTYLPRINKMTGNNHHSYAIYQTYNHISTYAFHYTC